MRPAVWNPGWPAAARAVADEALTAWLEKPAGRVRGSHMPAWKGVVQKLAPPAARVRPLQLPEEAR